MAELPDVTTLLESIRQGDGAARRNAQGKLYELVYDQLHMLAERLLRREKRADPLLQPTLLVNEAFQRLVGKNVNAKDRREFFSFAARALRQILVEYARKRNIRGGDQQLSVVSWGLITPDEEPLDILALHEALEQLAELAPRQSQFVELRFFAGLSLEEIAEQLNVSLSTVKRDWQFARLWLYREITKGEQI